MNKRYILIAIFAVMLLVGTLFSSDSETDQMRVYKLKLNILKLKKNIKYFKAQRKILDIQIIEFNKNLNKRLSEEKGRLRQCQGELFKERGRLKEKELLFVASSNRRKLFENLLSYFKRENTGLLNRFRYLVKNSFPFMLDAKSGAISRLLTETQLTSVSGMESYNRLWCLVKKDLYTSFDSRVHKIEIGNKQLRLGNGLVFFLKNSKYELLFRKINPDGISWLRKSDCLSYSQRSAVKLSFKIAEGKKAPDFILLPLSTSLIDWKE